MLRLRVTLEGNRLEEREVSDQLVVGRSADCAMRLDRKTASSRHARFDVRDDGATITDLGSTNGTFLNGDRMEARQAAELKMGDKVWLASYEFEVVALPQPEPETTTGSFPSEADEPAPAIPAGIDQTLAVKPSGGGSLGDRARLEHGRPRLVVGTRGQRESLELADVTATLGRNGGECQVVLNHRSVSSTHARIRLHSGVFRIEDLNSANGTFVDGHPVDRPTPLEPEQVVRLGEAISCLFVLNPPAGEEEAADRLNRAVASYLVRTGKLSSRQAREIVDQARSKREHLGEKLILQGILTPEEWSETLQKARMWDFPQEPWHRRHRMLLLIAALLALVFLLFQMVGAD